MGHEARVEPVAVGVCSGGTGCCASETAASGDRRCRRRGGTCWVGGCGGRGGDGRVPCGRGRGCRGCGDLGAPVGFDWIGWWRWRLRRRGVAVRRSGSGAVGARGAESDRGVVLRVGGRRRRGAGAGRAGALGRRDRAGVAVTGGHPGGCAAQGRRRARFRERRGRLQPDSAVRLPLGGVARPGCGSPRCSAGTGPIRSSHGSSRRWWCGRQPGPAWRALLLSVCQPAVAAEPPLQPPQHHREREEHAHQQHLTAEITHRTPSSPRHPDEPQRATALPGPPPALTVP